MTRLACQKALFTLDPSVTYLNAASSSPLPLSVQEAGAAGVAAKANPWRRDPALAERIADEARQAAAAIINAQADDIAIVGAVSYAIATVCANTRVSPGDRILMLEGEHSSLPLNWGAFAARTGAVVEVVARPPHGDWTEAVLEAVARSGATPVGIAALTPLFWNDGTLIDLQRVAPALRANGVPLLIDATQAVGVLSVDVAALQPDFLVFPSYKWTLGPYGLAFLYVAPHRQDGRPLEEHVGNRHASAALDYLPGARRFDRGERDSFVTIPMATAGLRCVADLGRAAIEERLRFLTDHFVAAMADLPIRVAPRSTRAPHILGLRFATPPTQALVDAMGADRLFVSLRGEGVRVSPHVFNEEADLDRCADWLRSNGAAHGL